MTLAQGRAIFRVKDMRSLFLLAAFSVGATSSVNAGPPANVGAAASAHSRGSGVAFVSGSLQPPGLMSASQVRTTSAVDIFAAPPGQSSAAANSGSQVGNLPVTVAADPFVSQPTVTVMGGGSASSAGSGSSGSGGFVYVAPGGSLNIAPQPNESAIAAADLTPFADVMRPSFSSIMDGIKPAGAAGSNLDVSGASHYEASFYPNWVLCPKSRYPVTVMIPTQVNVSEDPYWLGHGYAWIAAGIDLRVPLSFIPSKYGKWSASTSAGFCFYGTNTTEFVNSIGPQIPKIGAALKVEL